jgi:hypothetical protein
MTLQFPTQAERALETWQSYPGTISLTIICERYGGSRELYYEHGKRIIEYTFDDDTAVVIRGQGKSHQAETRLP